MPTQGGLRMPSPGGGSAQRARHAFNRTRQISLASHARAGELVSAAQGLVSLGAGGREEVRGGEGEGRGECKREHTRERNGKARHLQEGRLAQQLERLGVLHVAELACTISPDAQGGKLSVGDAVLARYKDGSWYPAHIAKCLCGATFQIAWDDDDTTDRIKTLSQLRLPPQPRDLASPPPRCAAAVGSRAAVSANTQGGECSLPLGRPTKKEPLPLIAAHRTSSVGGPSSGVCGASGMEAAEGKDELKGMDWKGAYRSCLSASRV